MSLALVHSRAQVGVTAPHVSVETHLPNGLPVLTLVGLPEATVNERKDRVRSAIVNSGLDYPARRITQSLAPADLPKDGGYGLDDGVDMQAIKFPAWTLLERPMADNHQG